MFGNPKYKVKNMALPTNRYITKGFSPIEKKITLLKKSVGWQRIHYEIMFPKNRRNKVQDIFSMDEYGKYLDDECGKITYW